MDFQEILNKEYEKLTALKNLRNDIQHHPSFDIEDVNEMDSYITHREKTLGEKQRVLEDVYKLQKMIMEREQILQQFEEKTSILTNTNLLKFFKEKQKKLIETMNRIND